MQDDAQFDLDLIKEDIDIEVKKAAGRHGKGEFPSEVLPTYSAMANTEGGIIYLGVEEKDGAFYPVGIQDTSYVIKSMWDALNNRQRVSKNILNDRMVEVVRWNDKDIVKITIPRARREDRPIYIGASPFTGTYKRNFEGDYVCDEATVKRLIADQVEVSRDQKILCDFDYSDFDSSSIKAYRNQFASAKADHPFLMGDEKDFLRNIGAWGKDRISKEEGPTVAGILMFGKFNSIREIFPNYFVDYQERPEPKAEARWIDRVEPDGTWSGNLYDFYRKVILKLYEGIKVPFVLKDGVRVDMTPVHEALREGLINTIIHADFSGSVGILVVKRPDLYGFRNPGTMRISIDDAIKGGVSDSRNKTIQQMFRYIGAGEQAGSGVPKIFKAWKEQSWRLPVFKEKTDKPDYTQLELRTVSLLPENAMNELRQRFADKVDHLNEVQRIALVTVVIEGDVTHARLKSMVSDHPADITKQLAGLVKDGFLVSSGASRGTYYYFQDTPPRDESNSPHLDSSSPHLTENQELSSPRLNSSSPHLKDSEELWNQALKLTEVARNKKKLSSDEMKEAILLIASLGYVTLKEFAELLKRNPEGLQDRYLNEMLKEGTLELKFPLKPQHPQQAYKKK